MHVVFCSNYKIDTENVKEIPSDMFKLPVKQIPFYNITAAGPAGSINSNLEDMEKWIRFQMSDGKVGDKQILSKEFMASMHTPHMVVDEEDFQLNYSEIMHPSYGFAWFIQPYRGRNMIHHGGNIDGFSAFMSFMPEEKIGIVILTNMDGTLLDEVIAFNIYDRLLGLNQVPWSERFKDKMSLRLKQGKEKLAQMEKERNKNTKPSHPLKDYTGIYEHPAFGDVLVELKEGSLYVSFEDISKPLENYQYDTFKTVTFGPLSSGNLKVRFLMNDSGDIDSLSMPLQDGAEDIVFKKVVEEKG